MYTLAGALLLLLGVTVAAFQPLWAEATPEPAVSDALSALLPPTNSPQVNPAPRGDDGGHTLYAHGDRLRPLVEETDGAQTLNIYGPGGQIIAQVARDGSGGQEARHLLADHLGSTRAALDADGNVMARFEYGPYGEAVGTAAAEVRFRYTGHPYDEQQGLYDTPARGYDPTTGRFLSVDPQRQEASPYVYAGNNPVGFLDPTGGGEVPFFVFTGFGAELAGKYIVSFQAHALGLEFGIDSYSNQRVYSAAIFDPAGRLSDAEHYSKKLMLGQKNKAGKYERGYTYNDKMYLFVGDETNVDQMSRLKQGVKAFREYHPEFAREVTIINFATDRSNAEGIRDTLKGMGIDPLLLDATIIGEMKPDGRGKRFNLRNVAVGKALYTPQAFVEYVHKVETAGKRIPVAITPDRGPSRLENGGVRPSNLIELTPGEHTLRIGMPMERGVGIFTYQGVD